MASMDELLRQTTIKELEAKYTRTLEDLHESDRSGPRAAMLLRPFAGLNEEWEAFKAKVEPGDEIFEFCSSDASWVAHAGRTGIALVRNGRIADDLILLRN